MTGFAIAAVSLFLTIFALAAAVASKKNESIDDCYQRQSQSTAVH